MGLDPVGISVGLTLSYLHLSPELTNQFFPNMQGYFTSTYFRADQVGVLDIFFMVSTREEKIFAWWQALLFTQPE